MSKSPYRTAAGYRPSVLAEFWGVNPPWMQQAACAGSPTPDAWHDVKPRAVEWAVSVCRSCPVTPECLQFALSDPHLEGVWGGLTVDERAKVARRNRRSERLAAERKARQNEQS